jgi:hypothetical protein
MVETITEENANSENAEGASDANGEESGPFLQPTPFFLY